MCCEPANTRAQQTEDSLGFCPLERLVQLLADPKLCEGEVRRGLDVMSLQTSFDAVERTAVDRDDWASKLGHSDEALHVTSNPSDTRHVREPTEVKLYSDVVGELCC